MIKLLLAILAFTTIGFSAYSQQSDLDGSKRYIKIIIDSEVSSEAQSEITNAFKQIPGVKTSRMDNTTHIFLGIYEPNENLLEQTFTNWFTNHGYEIACYYDAVYTEGAMINLSKNNCR
ncbi:hypothetical protein [Fluviicola chungangensis]|uniref:Heavy-metal-associated domain-containing protein n=1 Tax=Fluviicola chungangensis TaxID=2597671 RepID=A0A556MGS2_9FLAO|nr:hypothetical protein [Fluviicola chungangensis]TSJ39090.1 hypothetical protein FO442_18120 [Fluviicola chungangensis]